MLALLINNKWPLLEAGILLCEKWLASSHGGLGDIARSIVLTRGKGRGGETDICV
jgi:hypothetical protein